MAQAHPLEALANSIEVQASPSVIPDAIGSEPNLEPFLTTLGIAATAGAVTGLILYAAELEAAFGFLEAYKHVTAPDLCTAVVGGAAKGVYYTIALSTFGIDLTPGLLAFKAGLDAILVPRVDPIFEPVCTDLVSTLSSGYTQLFLDLRAFYFQIAGKQSAIKTAIAPVVNSLTEEIRRNLPTGLVQGNISLLGVELASNEFLHKTTFSPGEAVILAIAVILGRPENISIQVHISSGAGPFRIIEQTFSANALNSGPNVILIPLTIPLAGPAALNAPVTGIVTLRSISTGEVRQLPLGSGLRITGFGGVGAAPFITSSLELQQSPPYSVGQTITGKFRITNLGNASITFDVLTIGGRLNGVCSNDGCPDFRPKQTLSLAPGDSFQYVGDLTLLKPGSYHFFAAYQTPDGQWNTGIPTAVGLTNALDITVTLGSGGGFPAEVLTPVEGPFRVTGPENDECVNVANLWTFCQHQTGGHQLGGGLGGADDTFAWDMNLLGGADSGKAVFAVASGKVVRYSGLYAPGETYGAVLIEHSSENGIWWSGYLHMSNIQVVEGQQVDTSTRLGLISNVSNFNIPDHLHFVVYGGTNQLSGLISRNVQFLERTVSGGGGPGSNQPPTITSLTPNATSVAPNGTATLTVAASDPESDPLTYTWSATCGTLSTTTGQGPVTWTAPGSPTTCSVTVSVTDNKLGHTPATKSVDITVGSCAFALSPSSQSFGASGGMGSVAVMTQTGCSWSATSSASWLTITSGSPGSGNGMVGFSVGTNLNPSQRQATITVQGQVFTVTQAGAPTPGTLNVTTTPVSGGIFVDGTLRGNGSISIQLAAGGHSVGFGPVQGYTTPPDQFVNIVAGQTVSITGMYNPVPSTTVDLTILVRNANILAAIASATVSISGPTPRSGLTNSSGLVLFSGITQGNYTVTASATGYSTNSHSIAVIGASQIQDEIRLTPITSPPSAFTLFTPTANCPSKVPAIHLDWSDSTGAVRYDVYRNGSFYVNTATDSFFNNTANVSFGVNYSYFIRAVGSTGLTTDSNSVSIQATCQVTVGGTGGIGLKLRTCASTNDAVCPVITVLPDGTVMTIFAGPVAADGFNWYAIQGGAGTGWSAGNWLIP